MEVAAHGYTHASLTAVTAPEVISEVFRDRVELEKATGEIIRGMAYAYGAVNDSVVQCLKDAGILYCRTTASTRQFSIPQDLLRLPATCHHNDRELMALAKRFVEIPLRNDAMLFYLWGHSYEFDDNNNWNVIEEFCELVSGNDSIWYATNREIMEYITDYRALIPSADGSTIYNPTARTLFFVAKGNEYVVESGKSVKIS